MMRTTPTIVMETLVSPHCSWCLRVGGEESIASSLESRDVGHNFTSVKDVVAYLCGFSSRTPYLICGPGLNLEHKYVLLC